MRAKSYRVRVKLAWRWGAHGGEGSARAGEKRQRSSVKAGWRPAGRKVNSEPEHRDTDILGVACPVGVEHWDTHTFTAHRKCRLRMKPVRKRMMLDDVAGSWFVWCALGVRSV